VAFVLFICMPGSRAYSNCAFAQCKRKERLAWRELKSPDYVYHFEQHRREGLARRAAQTYARPMAELEAKKLEIKKYPNRRYYDATHSRHLTLEEIRTLVQQGYDLTVVDARTSGDITAQVLTQIILELDTSKLDSLPVPLLVRIIRMNDQLVKDFVEKYFNQALQSFLDYQRRVEEQIRQTHGLPSALPLVTAWTKAVLEPFSSVLARGAGAAAPKEKGPSTPELVSQLEQTVRDLQAQVARLQSTKPRLARRAKRQKKPGR
jgi:polyhydroxyalkanoate synthesis repressor PhaR